MDLFIDFISNFHLRDIFISGAKFTWSNKQKVPLLVKLDRILATSSWEMKYSNCFAWSKARVGSDHTPLILDTGDKGVPRPKYFYFEEKWLHQEGFHALVQNK
jgi:hypothetical protein